MAKKLRIKVAFNVDQLELRGLVTKGKAEGDLPAKLKWNTGSQRYCIANEYIAGTLGRFVGLPIPPFAVVHSSEHLFGARPIFGSLNINWDRKDDLPIWPQSCWDRLPDLCTGATVFDAWIANSDRWDKNLAVDDTFKPRQMQLFDHGEALLGTEGVERLERVKGSLGITGKHPEEGYRHIFLDEIDTQQFMNEWIERIYFVPHSFMQRTCERALHSEVGCIRRVNGMRCAPGIYLVDAPANAPQ